jgi:hypothetical protein
MGCNITPKIKQIPVTKLSLSLFHLDEQKPAKACATPDIVNMLFLKRLWTQQLIRLIKTVADMTMIPVMRKTVAAFHTDGYT